MSKTFDTRLIHLLESDRRFTDQNGKLIKQIVIDKAWKMDPGLIRLLLSEPKIKAKFFDKIDKALIFNNNTLIEYIMVKNFWRFVMDNFHKEFNRSFIAIIKKSYILKNNFLVLIMCFVSLIPVKAEECIKWFEKEGIKKGEDCLIECSMIETDMGTFYCPEHCDRLCKEQITEQVIKEFTIIPTKELVKKPYLSIKIIKELLKYL